MKNVFLGIMLAAAIISPAIKAETITIAGEDDWAPFSSATKDGKGIEGFAPEIIKAAFKSQQIDVNFKVLPYARCMDEALKGDVLGCFDTVMDNDNKTKYLFHKTPMFEASMDIWGPTSSKEQNVTLKDLEGKKVGITNGYSYSPEFTDNTKILKEVTPSEKSQFEKLAAERISYAAVFGMPGFYILKSDARLASKIKKIGNISTDKVFLSFSKVHKDGAKYTEVFEKGLTAIKADGTYKKLEDDFKKRLGI
ncbi:MAG: transporter substrate-binding domain-containing protein [Bacteriovorax sp.]|nr:transporter substrate-binding domain-containing protein [Bacteriovorax sp.]